MNADPFVEYYAKESATRAAVDHFIRLRDVVSRALGMAYSLSGTRVADIGCGAGTFSRVWADAGCIVSGIDVNADLIEIARTRATTDALSINFQAGSADSLPWGDCEFDIVVMPELLEHVANWEQCLSEAARVLRPGGVLYVSTTNRLCPVQREFELPLYSWYPGWLKRRCLRLSLTTHRHWVNHAAFPAVNWFDPYTLGAHFRELGLVPMDRFRLLADFSTEGKKRFVGKLVGALPPVTLLGHVMSPGTTLLGRKM